MQRILPAQLKALAAALDAPLYVVGGSVRDFLAGADAGRNPALLLSAPAAARDRRVYWPVTQHSGAAYPACLAAVTAAHGGKTL